MVDNIEERLLRTEEEDRSDLKQRIWVESKKIWRVAAPGILARVASFGLLVVTQSFIGHISEIDLAAYALVQTLIVRFANGIVIGMSSATETLCGQAFGAGHYHMMGIYLQRSWIVGFVTATLMLPLFIFTEPIFRLLGEEKSITVESKDISLWFIPFIYLSVFFVTMQMYLQAQLKNMVVGWLSAGAFIFHLIASWLFVSKLNLGLPGAMGSLVLSSWLMPFGLFVYIFGGWCPLSWKGFSRAGLSNLWPLVKLSVSSGIMICLEMWYNSILVLIAGYMSDAETAISAFSICLNVSGWEFMMCLGFLGAACLLFGHNIGYLFTSNEEVAETVADLSVLLAFTMLFNSIQPVLSGVAVGAGLQGTVAIINLCSYYVIGIPLGCLLAYVTDLEVKGIWIGMLSGMGVQILALAFMVWRTDWDLQVCKAFERLGRWFLKPSEEPDESLIA